jgi:phosphoribosylamine--glycine ligase
MRVLVIGGGGREHALCWKLRQSPQLSELFCAPGNPGIAEVADLVPMEVENVPQLADFASEMKVDLTVVGPELPLTLGLVDEFVGRGLAVFGPRKQAAELEGSKVFAKQFMGRHQIPTAPFTVAHDAEDAWNAVLDLGLPVVLKADGLAAGKGVLIPRDEQELVEALAIFFDERRFGEAGSRVVVEKFLEGEEVSFIGLSDGERVLPLASSKDYKRIGEGDTGPNTGGMGAHSPAGVLGAEDAAWVLESVMQRTVAGLAEESRPFVGVLYAGLILTADGPRVLEFNVRFGDPETQPLMLRLEDDLLPVLAEAAAGRFTTQRLRFRQEAAACVVLASAPYPERPETGEPIIGLEAAGSREAVEIFHAGTAEREGRLVTAGGRVLNVCASGSSLRHALRRAYEAAADLDWPAKRLREDIGRRLLEGDPEA